MPTCGWNESKYSDSAFKSIHGSSYLYSFQPLVGTYINGWIIFTLLRKTYESHVTQIGQKLHIVVVYGHF